MDLPLSQCSGVYMIVNTVSSKLYIGSAAKSLRGRAAAHRDELEGNRHPNIHLQRAWNKYGGDKFKFVVLEECSPKSCIVREQKWIDTLQAVKRGYNINPKAGSRLGSKLSDESKSKISASKTGKKLPMKTRLRMSKSQRGRLISEVHKQNLSSNHWTKGPNAEEIKAQIAAKLLGEKHSEERKRKNSESCLRARRKPLT